MKSSLAGQATSTLPGDDNHAYRTGPWRPQTAEYDAELDVVGELPSDLEGVYLRNTENPVHPSVKRYHPYDGDGMLHSVAIRNGHVSYRNRFVRTDGFVAEANAGRALWAGIAENPRLSPRDDGWGARGRMKDASSTDVVVHAGLALSTFWQCGDVYQLDPVTLKDHGKATWGGKFPSDRGVSAHARVDERTGDLLFFNYSTEAPYLCYGVVGPDQQLSHYVPIDIPGPRLPHDLAFTPNYTILNDLPLFWEPKLLEQGRYAVRFNRHMPSRLGVIPRFGDSKSIQWFDADPTYVLHWVNAYEDGDEIVLDGFFQGSPEPTEAKSEIR